MILANKFQYKQGSTVFNTAGSNVLRFDYVKTNLSNVTPINADIMEKLYIEFASISGTISLVLGCLIHETELGQVNPAQFVPDVGLSLDSIGPIDTTKFYQGTDGIYRGYFDIIQTDSKEDIAMLMTLGSSAAITGLNICITNEIKGRING